MVTAHVANFNNGFSWQDYPWWRFIWAVFTWQSFMRRGGSQGRSWGEGPHGGIFLSNGRVLLVGIHGTALSGRK
jgi:hypothetical protein